MRGDGKARSKSAKEKLDQPPLWGGRRLNEAREGGLLLLDADLRIFPEHVRTADKGVEPAQI
jgi:hypothetical protein